jgi:hypothetical protein
MKAGRKKNSLWKFFAEQQDKTLLCRGCQKQTLSASARLVALKQHLSECEKLQSLVRDGAGISSSKKSTRSGAGIDGSVLEWIKKATDKTATERFADAWMRFALSKNLSIRSLSSPEFVFAAEVAHEMGGVHPIRFAETQRSMMRLKSHIVSQLQEQVKNHCVCLIIDGWHVKYKKEHSHGFLFSDWNDHVIFHTLVGDLRRHTSEYVVELTTKAITEIEFFLSVQLVAMTCLMTILDCAGNAETKSALSCNICDNEDKENLLMIAIHDFFQSDAEKINDELLFLVVTWKDTEEHVLHSECRTGSILISTSVS